MITGGIASLLEGIGISLILPIINGNGGMGSFVIPFPFNRLMGAFAGMDIATKLKIVAISLIGITGIKSFMLYLNNLYVCKLQIKAMKHFRIKCFEQLMNVGLSYFNKNNSADYQTICSGYAGTLATWVSLLGGAGPKVFNIIVLIMMMFILSWKMLVISMLLIIFVSLFLRNIYLRAETAGKLYSSAIMTINQHLLNSILGMKVIRIFNRENETMLSYEKEIDAYNKALYKLTESRGAVQPLFEFLGILVISIIIILASFFLFGDGENRLGILVVFLVVFQRLISPVMMINQLRVALVGDLPAFREVFKFLDVKNKHYVINGKGKFPGLKSMIEFNNVSFSYQKDKMIVLDKIKFYIKKGTKVGIVGSSGAGKSTITELLLRFYDPDSGEILVDGLDLKTLDLGSWRNSVGVVSQDIFLFNDTIKGNISYAKPSATLVEIEAAARKAHAHNFICEMPNGYDTLIGDRGVLLSGGQRQRIAIARAIIINPEILIFDEATSALDTESEKIVQEALEDVGKGRTVITIAHRLSTIFDSDKIIVLDAGKVVGEGRHEELYAAGGLYTKLVNMQNFNHSYSKEKLV